MKTTTELTEDIRRDLESHGWKPRKDISVRKRYCGYSSAIDLEIKNPNIYFKDVEKIAEPYGNIRYDLYGEILSGGNCYVSVRYSDETMKEKENIVRRDVMANVETFDNEYTEGDSGLLPFEIGKTHFLLGKETGKNPPYVIRVDNEDVRINYRAYNHDDVINVVARFARL